MRIWVVRSLTILLALSSVTAVSADEIRPMAPDVSSAVERAKAVSEEAKRLRQQRLMGPGPGAPAGSLPVTGVKRREGIWYFVSWSIPEPELKTSLREAFRLGATVVFRGLTNDNMKETVERTKALAIALDREAPHVAIDPVIFRQFGIRSVPALAVAKDQQAVIVEGAAPVKYLLAVLSREEAGVKPIATWFDGQMRGWDFGGPSNELRPLTPSLTGIRTVATELPKYPILERDLQVVMQERFRTTDMRPFQRELESKVKERLKAGPGLALPVATESRTFAVDLTQRIDHDIANHDGSAVVVKAGTVVNPLAHLTYRHRLIVIDGRDPKQVAFAKEQIRHYGAYAVKVLLTEGDFEVVANALHDRVFWLQPEILSRFHLAHVPSVVTQNGPLLQVEEVRL